MRFKEFLLEEFASTERQGIIHFQDMKPLESYKFLKNLSTNFAGQLKNIPITLKVDGASFRFGKDENGKFFVETGHSGIIQKEKAFSEYTKDNTTDKVRIERAGHYDEIYKILKDSEIWEDLPNNTKIICEILYNPMASDEDNKLKFVIVKYDKAKLGSLMTIVPISAIETSSGKTKDKSILTDLINQSNSKIKIIDNKLPDLSINLKTQLAPLSFIEKDVEEILKSRKASDKDKKQEYIDILNAIKDEIATEILKSPIKGKNILGTDNEGIVLELDGKFYKMTTNKFKNAKKLLNN